MKNRLPVGKTRPLFLLCLFLFPLLLWGQLSVVELAIRKNLPAPVVTDTTVLNRLQSDPLWKTLSLPEQELVYWTNYSRVNPARFWDSVVVPHLKVYPSLAGPESASLETDLKASLPLPIFSLNSRLLQTARLHALDIARSESYPSHNSTNGTDFNTRMNEAGIRQCAYQNMAVGAHSILLSIVLLYLDIRLPEQGHRKALLNPSLIEIGVGYAPYGKDRFFLVQDMACKQ